MDHNSKTKEQLITELIELQKRIVEREKAGLEYKKAEEALQQALEYSEGIVETVREPLVILDADLKVISANRSFYRTFQVSKDETEGQYIYDIGNRQWNITDLRKLLSDILTKKTIIDDFVVQHDFPIIGYRTMLLNAREVIDHEKHKNILLAIEDVTERRRAEEKINASLKEKEMLLKEIHHRVKNNMTVITSLLQLQCNRIEDEHYKEMFNNSINRIKSMVRIHEQLYRSGDLAKVDFNDYVKTMIDRMFMSYGLSTQKVALKTEVRDVAFGIDIAIPCGLIINELLSNSLKYAFPEDREGEIKVSLYRNDKGEVELRVRDNGIGMPEDVDFRKTDTLGLNLVNALVGQLQGKIELYREKGTEFIITFKG